MNVIAWIRNLLGQFQWYRKRQSGHWELWRLPSNRGTAWLYVSSCYHARGRGPDPRLLGRPMQCEHYWPHLCTYLAIHEIESRPARSRCPVCYGRVDSHVQDPCHTREKEILVHRLCTGQLVALDLRTVFPSDAAQINFET